MIAIDLQAGADKVETFPPTPTERGTNLIRQYVDQHWGAAPASFPNWVQEDALQNILYDLMCYAEQNNVDFGECRRRAADAFYVAEDDL
jgi:hypothetical protein